MPMVKRSLTIAFNISSTLIRLSPPLRYMPILSRVNPRRHLKFANSAIGDYPGLAYHGTVSKLGRMNGHVSLHS
jgi:hypothetical protein